MGFKSVRDSLSATSPTWALSVSAFYVIQDHPAYIYIPRGQRWPLRPELALGPAAEIIPPESALSEREEAPGYPLAVSGVFGVVRHEGTFLDPALAAQLEGEQGG